MRPQELETASQPEGERIVAALIPRYRRAICLLILVYSVIVLTDLAPCNHSFEETLDGGSQGLEFLLTECLPSPPTCSLMCPRNEPANQSDSENVGLRPGISPPENYVFPLKSDRAV